VRAATASGRVCTLPGPARAAGQPAYSTPAATASAAVTSAGLAGCYPWFARILRRSRWLCGQSGSAGCAGGRNIHP